MKKKNYTNKKISRKSRKTKRKYGGNVLGNIVGEDKNIKEYFYETKITVKDKEYKINYFTPNNFLFVKLTDPLFIKPKFFLYFDKNSNTPYNVIIKIDKYVVSCIVKIQNDWYAITRTLEHVKKMNIKHLFYKINPGVLSNDNEKLYITKNKYKYKMEKKSITLDESTYTPIEEGDDVFMILFNFDIQQNAKAIAKEDGAFLGFLGMEELL